LSPSEIKGLRYAFLQVAEDRALRVHPLLRSMAFLLLDDRCFQGQPHLVVREIVDFILDGPGLFFAEDGLLSPTRAPLRFSDGAGRAQAVEHLKNRLTTVTSGTERRAAASSLARNAAEEDCIIDWWWTHFTPDRAWLEVASLLGCLEGGPNSRSRSVAEAVHRAEKDGPVHTLLTNFRSDDHAITRHLMAEINGALVTAKPGVNTVLERLLVAARGAAPRDREGEGRRRQRRVQGTLHRLKAAEGAAVVFSALGVQSSPAAWAEALDMVAQAWGESGWVIRDHVARIRSGVDLEVLSSLLSARESAVSTLVTEEAKRRRSAGDPDYWSRTKPPTSGVDAVEWIVSVLTRAHTSTIITLREHLNDVADALLPAQRAVAEQAIRSRGRCMSLILHDEFRLSRFAASVHLLRLLQAAAEGDTLGQVNKRLTAAAQDVDAKSFVDDGKVAELAGKLPVDWFRGGRDSVTSSGVEVQITGLNMSRAREILDNPGGWPPFVAYQAAQKLRTEIERQPPLSTIACRDRWFA
jgi:hypothetical protein